MTCSVARTSPPTMAIRSPPAANRQPTLSAWRNGPSGARAGGPNGIPHDGQLAAEVETRCPQSGHGLVLSRTSMLGPVFPSMGQLFPGAIKSARIGASFEQPRSDLCLGRSDPLTVEMAVGRLR